MDATSAGSATLRLGMSTTRSRLRSASAAPVATTAAATTSRPASTARPITIHLFIGFLLDPQLSGYEEAVLADARPLAKRKTARRRTGRFGAASRRRQKLWRTPKAIELKSPP
jgi:hypothetical protein